MKVMIGPLLLLANLLKKVVCLEMVYPIHKAYGDDLQLTKIAIVLVVILGLSLLFWLILSMTIYRTTSIKLMIVVAAVAFNLILYYTQSQYFSLKKMSAYFQIAPHMYFFYYLPIYIAQSCFEHQVSDFHAVAPYAFLTSMLIMLTALVTGYILYMITQVKWGITQMFVFGLATCSHQPDPFRYSLKNPSFIKLNQLTIGEYISTLIFTMCVIYEYLEDTSTGSTFVLILVIQILGGMLLGLMAGCFFALTLGITKDDAKSCFIIIIMSMICVYFLAMYAAVSPPVAVFSMVPSLYMYKKHFSRDANKAIREFFAMTHLVIDLVFYAYLVHIAIYVLVIESGDNTIQISYCIFGFICTIFMRSLVYLIMSPVIKRLYRQLDTVAIVVNAWATITSNGAFVIAFMFYLLERTKDFGTIILCQICFSSLCTSIINQLASEFLLRNHFATNFTADQAANINACLHEIRSLRVKYIYMWKMKGIVTDARWDIVKNYTNIFHTSKDNGVDQIMSYKNVTCPDCGREIQVQQPIKDVADFTKLSKKLINNQIRTILTRRHQFGAISTAAARYSVIIVEKCLTFDNHIQDELFQPFFNVGFIRKKLYAWKQFVYSNQDYLKRIPRKPYRARLYRFVHSTSFNYTIIALTTYSVVMLILMTLVTSFHSVYFYLMIALSKPFTIVMILQMYIFIQAYSIFSVRQGAKIYFKSVWHWLEVLTLFYSLIDSLVILILFLCDDEAAWNSYKYIRLVELIKILSAFKTILPKIIHSLEDVLVGRIALGFEVAKAIYDAYSELELSMDFIFDDNILMAAECERWVREDKQQLYQIITFVQFNYPSLARKVKTRQALDATSAVLNLMLEEVRSSGYVDLKEYEIIQKKLRSCEKQGQALGKINHRISFKDIVQNLPWIALTEAVVQEYLLSICTLRNLQTGEVLCNSGDTINGVYVLLTGMVRMEYVPTNEIISNLLKHGLLPVYKYSDSLQFFEPIQQILVPGNSIGEMSVAVRRPINVTCVTMQPSKVYFIQRDNIDVAETFIRDSVDGIIAQMWKMTCFNIAIAILKSLPKYEYYTQHDLKMKLESSFMPDLENFKVFCFLDAIDDLILLQGVVKDFYSDLFFVAPCYIPRSLIKFHMHVRNPSCDDEPTEEKVASKLLIISMPDIDKYAVMKLENEVGDLYSKSEGVPTALLEDKTKLLTKENRLAGVAAIKAVTQGNHLTKFINLKK